MKKILLSLLVTAMMLSCGEKMSVEKINELEAKVFAEGVSFEKENLIQLVDAYLLFAKQNPNDSQSPDFVFKALDVAVGTRAADIPARRGTYRVCPKARFRPQRART